MSTFNNVLGNFLPPPVLPIVSLAALELSATIGQGVLTVLDVQGRTERCEIQTQVGTATSTWSTQTPGGFLAGDTYTATVTFTASTLSYIRFKIIGFDYLGQAGQIIAQDEAIFPLGSSVSLVADDESLILATRVFGP